MIMNKTTLVIGASTNPERYAFKAIESLVNHGHTVRAHGLKPGEVHGVIIDINLVAYDGIHTVTLYIGQKNQPQIYAYVQSLKPKRVIFNPGTENDDFEKMLQSKGIETIEACTLVLLSTNQF